MGDDLNQDLELRPTTRHHSQPYSCYKSNYNLKANSETLKNINKTLLECYKKYGQGEGTSASTGNVIGLEDDNHSLTNSELDKLELKIFEKISQEFQIRKNNTDEQSRKFNVKLFKMTVQAIIDNFFAHMDEYEVFKKRFQYILAKNEDDAIEDINNFLCDIIQHLSSSNSSSHSTTDCKSSCEKPQVKQKITAAKKDVGEAKNREETNQIKRRNVFSGPSRTRFSSDSSSDVLVEKFKKDDYQSESVNTRSDSSRVRVLNIFYLLCAPYVHGLESRDRLSEMYIKDTGIPIGDDKNVRSAEDLRKVASKKKEIQHYVESDSYFHEEREIPVKVSFAKNNIHLDEDFKTDSESEKSFISKICSFLCRKFRKV